MDLTRIYQCLSEPARLRIVHLLTRGPLCVCHFQGILGESQVKVSQQLAYLKKHGLVDVTRHGQWRIYRLPARRSPRLDAHLQCLRDCARTDPRLRSDLKKLRALQADCQWVTDALDARCC